MCKGGPLSRIASIPGVEARQRERGCGNCTGRGHYGFWAEAGTGIWRAMLWAGNLASIRGKSWRKSMEELGNIVHRMQRRKLNGNKWTLKTELMQYRDANEVMKRLPGEWPQLLYDQLGLRKSSIYAGVQVYKEFGHLLLQQVDGNDGDDGWDIRCEYATILPSSLILLLKVAKGVNDDAKESWLFEAASLSYADFRRRIGEATGKEAHECGPWEETKAWKCVSCGKVRAKAPDGEVGQ